MAENETSSSSPPVSYQNVTRFFIALLATIPYIIVKLLLIYALPVLTYFSMAKVNNIVLGVWTVGLIFEFLIRWKLSLLKFRIPWFSLIGICFLSIVLHISAWVRPVVLCIPHWNHISQSVRWDTHKPNHNRGGNHWYVLVLEGRGQIGRASCRERVFVCV